MNESILGNNEYGNQRFVPFAKDSSWFGPHLGERGYFQVGAKGEEQKFESFDEAMFALRAMTTARWRRPNAKGIWGIVTAIEWKPAE